MESYSLSKKQTYQSQDKFSNRDPLSSTMHNHESTLQIQPRNDPLDSSLSNLFQVNAKAVKLSTTRNFLRSQTPYMKGLAAKSGDSRIEKLKVEKPIQTREYYEQYNNSFMEEGGSLHTYSKLPFVNEYKSLRRATKEFEKEASARKPKPVEEMEALNFKLAEMSKAQKFMKKSHREAICQVRQQQAKYNLDPSYLTSQNELTLNSSTTLKDEFDQTSKNKQLCLDLERKRIEKSSLYLDQVEINLQNEEDLQQMDSIKLKKYFMVYKDAVDRVVHNVPPRFQMYSEKFMSFLERVQVGYEAVQNKIEKTVQGISAHYEKDLQHLKEELRARDNEITKLHSQLLSESQMFSDVQRHELEEQVLAFLRSSNQDGLEDDEVTSKAKTLLESLKYSNAQQTLTEVHTILNIWKGFSKGVEQEEEEKGILEKNNIVLNELANDFDMKVKYAQRQTAKKILQRYFKGAKTTEVGVQKDQDEDQVESLRLVVGVKESMISSYKQDIMEMKANMKIQDEKIAQRGLQIEQLNVSIKTLQKELDLAKKDQERILSEKQRELDREKDEKENFKDRLDQMTEEFFKTDDLKTTYKRQILEFSGMIDGLNERITTLNLEINSKQEQIEQLERQLEQSTPSRSYPKYQPRGQNQSRNQNMYSNKTGSIGNASSLERPQESVMGQSQDGVGSQEGEDHVDQDQSRIETQGEEIDEGMRDEVHLAIGVQDLDGRDRKDNIPEVKIESIESLEEKDGDKGSKEKKIKKKKVVKKDLLDDKSKKRASNAKQNIQASASPAAKSSKASHSKNFSDQMSKQKNLGVQDNKTAQRSRLSKHERNNSKESDAKNSEYKSSSRKQESSLPSKGPIGKPKYSILETFDEEGKSTLENPTLSQGRHSQPKHEEQEVKVHQIQEIEVQNRDQNQKVKNVQKIVIPTYTQEKPQGSSSNRRKIDLVSQQVLSQNNQERHPYHQDMPYKQGQQNLSQFQSKAKFTEDMPNSTISISESGQLLSPAKVFDVKLGKQAQKQFNYKSLSKVRQSANINPNEKSTQTQLQFSKEAEVQTQHNTVRIFTEEKGLQAEIGDIQLDFERVQTYYKNLEKLYGNSKSRMAGDIFFSQGGTLNPYPNTMKHQDLTHKEAPHSLERQTLNKGIQIRTQMGVGGGGDAYNNQEIEKLYGQSSARARRSPESDQFFEIIQLDVGKLR